MRVSWVVGVRWGVRARAEVRGEVTTTRRNVVRATVRVR